jgi:integrase
MGMILDHCAKTYDKYYMDYWMPVLAAYTGARREEIGQLTVDNVRLVGNMYVIEITDAEAEQSVKTRNSLRSIPLPSVILEAGFVEYVQERKAEGAKYLFQQSYTDNKTKVASLVDVKTNKRGQFSEPYGKRFAEKVREPLGLTDKGMVFHSIRHSFTDSARRAGVGDEIRRKIAGRMENEDPVEGGYGDDELLSEKLEALEAIAHHVRS